MNPIMQDVMYELQVQSDHSELIRYNIPGMPIYTDKAAFTLEHNFSHESHWHNDVEFGLITRGQLQFNINGNDIKLTAGQGVFVNSKQIHHAFSHGKNHWEGVCLIFSPLLLCSNEYIEREFVNPVINNRRFPYAVLTQDTPWQREVFELVCQAQALSFEKSSPLQYQSLFCRIFKELYNNMPAESRNAGDFVCDYNLSILKEMIGFIHTHYAKKISLTDICNAGSVCRSKCGSLFKTYLHQTPMDYLAAHRLRKAVKLMEETSESMNEIADSVGFASASYFAETFRKNYNCSPSEYSLGTF